MTERRTDRDAIVIGVDLGGTKTAVMAVDTAGNPVRGERFETDARRGADAVLGDLIERIDGVRRGLGDRVGSRIGVGVAGQVDPETGTVMYAPNLGWRDVPVRAMLEAALGGDVAVLNDVRAATLAEAEHGAGQDETDLVCLYVGTGVGGGVIADGRLLRGCTGSAGELGHMTVDLHGPVCGCGNRGCIEAFAGGRAIAMRAEQELTARPSAGTTLHEMSRGDPDRITAGLVARAADAGDPLARAILDEAAEALVAGAASIVNAFNPCLLLLGGGVIDGVPALVDHVRAALPVRALGSALRGLRVERAALGADAGAIGAAVWARRTARGRGEADS